MPCWNSSDEVLRYIGPNRSEEVFLDLWAEYQGKALNAYDAANQNVTSSIILWTSTLTNPDRILKYLPSNRYIKKRFKQSDRVFYNTVDMLFKHGSRNPIPFQNSCSNWDINL